MGLEPIFCFGMKVNKQLQALIEPVVSGLGYEFWGLEYLSHGKSSVLKVYIDAEGGIDVDDCAKVSRQISSLFDVEEPITGKYSLEVSSPGMNRRLFTKEQYEVYKGARLKVSLRTPFEGQRKFTGLLCGLEDEDVILRVGDEEILFPYDDIDKATVVPVFD